MSFGDQKEFIKQIYPFDSLTDSQLTRAIQDVEIGFYHSGATLTTIGETPKVLYMVIKGEVKAYDSVGDIVRVYHAHESFDADALIEGRSGIEYRVTEDLICYELNQVSFMRAFDENRSFQEFYLMDIVERISHLSKIETSPNANEFMVARVEDAYLHKPCMVTQDCTLQEALIKSVEMKSSSIVIERDGEYGIVTDSDIKVALSQGVLNLSQPIISMAKFPIITVEHDDFLFNVYLLLIKKSIKRVAVMRDSQIIGMLEQMDILSYFANHSHLVIVKIEKAKDIDELRSASLDYINIVKKLYNQGVKARYIAKLISEINQRVFQKLFEFIVPTKLIDSSVLCVMGSEGRGEQILRTDQDNCLIIQDGIDEEQYYPYMAEMTQRLVEFGYPPCDGDIMVSNPYWCKSVSSYAKEIRRWIETPDSDSYMYFSIFLDAQPIVGDEALLTQLKSNIYEQLNTNNDIYMARFANLTTLFETPVGFFSTFLHRDRKIDIKKGAIFPIVQGIRALSLQQRISKLSTVDRIKELNNSGVIEDDMAKELVEALEILFSLRLGQQLEELQEHTDATNHIDTQKLSKIQRDLLKDSLHIVERFKKFIVRYFSLDSLG